MHEIILPETKPALEWVNNRVVRKVTPRPRHSQAQGAFTTALARWTQKHRNGFAGPELHCQVRPPGEISRTLVPDVAFLSYERWPLEKVRANVTVRVAPDAV